MALAAAGVLGPPDVLPVEPQPQIWKETVEAEELTPHERVQQRAVEHIADASQFREETVQVERLGSGWW